MTDDRFRLAARAYFAYGVVYLVGGLYLVAHGVGVAGAELPGARATAVVRWTLVGLIPLVVIPFLLRRPRAWFERWVLSRRDFARLVAAFMAVRAVAVLRVALRPETASVPAPWGGDIGFRTGAAVFFVVTVAALALVVRAAWAAPDARTAR